ncbi:MAG: hypothetical protein ACRD2D_07215 [Terriglobales bacterium]
MSERSQLLKRMAMAHALGNRAVPYTRDQQLNPLTADLDEPARELGKLLRYAAAHPGDPMSEEIRRTYDLLATVFAAPRRDPMEKLSALEIPFKGPAAGQ